MNLVITDDGYCILRGVSKKDSDDEIRMFIKTHYGINSEYVYGICIDCGFIYTSPKGNTDNAIIYRKCKNHK